MYCAHCGNRISEEASFCTQCGAKAAISQPHTVVSRISGSPIEVYVETNSPSAIALCHRLHSELNLPYPIAQTPEQADRRWKPGMACFYVKGNEWDILNLKEAITMRLLVEGWQMQPATSIFVREETEL